MKLKNSNRNRFFISMIVILIILLIMVLVALLKISNKEVSETNNTEQKVDYYNEYQTQRASEGVTADDAVASLEREANRYYTVEGIISNFNTYVSYLDSTISDLGLIVPEGQEKQALQEYRADGLNYITNMLANNYKTKYSVNDEYLYNLLKNYSRKNYKITDMYVVEDSAYINTYFVYGNYSNEEFNYIVILDKYNYTFEIYLNNYFKDGEYSKDDISTMKTLHVEKIEKNDNNTFQYKNINREELANTYYKDYLEKMNNNIQTAYNLLDSEYKEVRFKTLTDFQDYISEVIKVDIPRSVWNYKITKYDDYTEYICQDNYGNIFVFKATGVMKYTAILDTYTVPVKSYEEEYNNSEDAKKAQLCLNRFFEALNNKDYESAYNYLNTTYRENNFKTVEEFKNYVQLNWFEYSRFTYSDAQKDEQNYMMSGSIDNTLTYGSYNDRHVQKTFIVKLGTSIRDFQISFNK